MITDLTKLDLQSKNLNNEKVNTINARLLWKELGVKTDFKDWIKRQIEYYDFTEGIDYILSIETLKNKVLLKKEENFINQGLINEEIDWNKENQEIKELTKKGGRSKKEYYITLDMAKELCMVENNSNGKKWRKFFIQCQKTLFSLEKNRYKQIAKRVNMTDKIQEIYIPNDKFYIYSNYTKLIYRKVFGFSDVKHIKKKYNLTEKEEIRKSMKIPYELQEKITNTEEAVGCFLTTLQYQKADKETCYKKVKEFLGV